MSPASRPTRWLPRRACIVAVFLCLAAQLCLTATAAANVRLTHNATEDTSPCADVGSDGLPRVAWSRWVDGGHQIMWAVFDRSGEAVVGPVQVTASATSSGSPNISLDVQDRSFLVWQEGAGTSAKTYFARVDADGTIGVAPRIVSTGNGYDWLPDIATSPDGVSHIAVQHTYATFWYCAYRRLDAAGDPICGDMPGDFCIFPIDKHVSIDLNDAGEALMSWSDYDYWVEGLYVAKYDAGCARITYGLLVNDEDISWSAVTPNGGGWNVLYQQRVGGVQRIRQWNDADDPVVSPAPGPSTRVRSAGAAGQPVYAVWNDGSVAPQQIGAARWDAAGALVDAELVISTGPAAASQPAVGTDGGGRYAVVWRDARHQAEAEGEIYLEMLPVVGIDVTVRSETTGNLLPDAAVTVLERGIGRKSVVTDADGLAPFRGLDPGEYTALATFAGHVSGLVVAVVPDDGVGEVEIRVATDTEVVGRLEDASPFRDPDDGLPLPVRGALVELLDGGIVVASTQSSSWGRYLFNVIEPGTYTCRAGKTGPPIPGEPSGTLYTDAVSPAVTVAAGDPEVVVPTMTLESKVVVLVHGWHSSGAMWNPGFVDVLETRGWTVVWNFNLPHQVPIVGTWGWAADKQQAEYLDAVVTGRLAVSSYHIVAHSQGGVVSRYLIEHYKPATLPRVTKCITLATPHHGSPAAGDVVSGVKILASAIAPSGFSLAFGMLLDLFREEYPATVDLDADSEFMRILNRGSENVEDWNGWCWPFEEPTELFLDGTTQYVTLAGTGDPGWDGGSREAALAGMARVLEGRFCSENDGIVPLQSARLYGAGNVHNYLASEFGIDVFHKNGSRASNIADHPEVQQLVAEWLDSDPTTWPPSHDLPRRAGRDPDAWTRTTLLQIPAVTGQTNESSLMVDSCDSLQVNWLWYTGTTDLVLVAPGGAVIDSTAAAAMPDVSYDRDPVGHAGRFVVADPAPGVWMLRVQDVAAEYEQNVMLWVDAAAARSLALAVSPDTPAMFSDHTIAAALAAPDGTPITAALGTASIEHPSGATGTLALLDDGLPPDAVAADGIYSAVLELETTPGTTVIDVSISGSDPDVFVRRAITSVDRGVSTDLGVVDPGLEVDGFNGLAGCRLNLDAMVINYGPEAADVAVTVLAEDEMTVLFSDTVYVSVGATIAVGASHLPLVPDDYRYTVRAWPVGGVGEFDPGDNAASVVVPVASPVTAVPTDPVGGQQPELERLLQGRAASLVSAYPNPFNPVVNLRCALAAPGPIVVDAYDIRGRRVWSHATEVLPAGLHEITWNGRDRVGQDLPSGMYLMLMRAGGVAEVKKVMLVR